MGKAQAKENIYIEFSVSPERYLTVDLNKK